MNVAQQIIERLGGTRKTASLTGDSPSTVQSWKKSGRFPADRLVEIEEKTKIPREELRPDLYRKADAQPAVEASEKRDAA